MAAGFTIPQTSNSRQPESRSFIPSRRDRNSRSNPGTTVCGRGSAGGQKRRPSVSVTQIGEQKRPVVGAQCSRPRTGATAENSRSGSRANVSGRRNRSGLEGQILARTGQPLRTQRVRRAWFRSNFVGCGVVGFEDAERMEASRPRLDYSDATGCGSHIPWNVTPAFGSFRVASGPSGIRSESKIITSVASR